MRERNCSQERIAAYEEQIRAILDGFLCQFDFRIRLLIQRSGEAKNYCYKKLQMTTKTQNAKEQKDAGARWRTMRCQIQRTRSPLSSLESEVRLSGGMGLNSG